MLVVSELVANAHLHTAGPREIGLDLGADRVRVGVTDGAATVRGHGLLVVERLSTRWAPDVQLFGKSVWAECPLRQYCPGSGKP
ncbi:ATP-binding protein [Streptomyces sp. NBC_01669]|uniref:ATP-binding protein n=1 Tax=Streptomyces sp. NBC_01669 TaxID=2975909 RepID=UPI0022550684|nr:ATP-binding protein [Streptomyces sp. NBC_01669]MCX4537679.1 ATP-binding protein [Streptomyces sp. NBC_01669]